MSGAWRSLFTYNKYAQITARAVRSSLKEEQRLAAEKRGLTMLRYQQWENGQGGPQIVLNEENAKSA
ncbi:hypothetical protein NP233_g6747 [Leucocoprinus birnbaumii]|uniref:Uncharacterized protein n=1 Tax=Leucocoprinus birnbaumii TaxID=56174 RepID=A0AAD5YPQ9_9AGAR|nr:hypothetical protein NP233_g6747 [Leucocoprinus birnbaumii]